MQQEKSEASCKEITRLTKLYLTSLLLTKIRKLLLHTYIMIVDKYKMTVD